MKAFISHKYEEKSKAISIKEHLNRCFIECWLDKNNLRAGQKLTTEILTAIQSSQFFVAMISKAYLDSDYCMLEYQRAEELRVRKKIVIIPVLLEPRIELIKKAESMGLVEIARTLDADLCLEFDTYNPIPCYEGIASSIQSGNSISFKPIEKKVVDGQLLQVIEVQHGQINPNFLADWDFNVLDFIDTSKNGEKPISMDIPVGIFGAKPTWLTALLAVPFFNKCDVFVFNQQPPTFICVYATIGNQAKFKGKVLKV